MPELTFDLNNVAVIDLFCGVGGLTHGFVRQGFNVVMGIDCDVTCEYAYEANNDAAFLCCDIEDVSGDDLNEAYGDAEIKILVGCAPCQSVSRYNRNASQLSMKYASLKPFAKLVREVRPTIVSMENVPGLRDSPAFDVFLATLKECGYHVWVETVYCPDYGVGQTRTRLVLLGSLLGPLEIIPPTHCPETYKKLKEVIGHLPAISAGQAHEDDPLHKSSSLNSLNLQRIKATPEGGGWADWDETLRLACHKKETGESYPSVYGRMAWDDLAPTMTTQCNGLGNGRFGHPEQDRAISLREAALIQSFPDTYDFVEEGEKIVIKNIARHIGNAVPVALGEAVAASIETHLGIHYGK